MDTAIDGIINPGPEDRNASRSLLLYGSHI
jgi:hypothetical protein